MNAPQVIWLCLAAAGLGIEAVKHGKPRTGNYSFMSQAMGVAISASLLFWGGFFEAAR